MSKRAICPGGDVPLDPNAHLPDPESEERQRLADEFERGRKAALAEMQQVGHLTTGLTTLGITMSTVANVTGYWGLSAFGYNTWGNSNY